MKFDSSTLTITDSVVQWITSKQSIYHFGDIPAVKDHGDKDGAAPFPTAQNHYFFEIDPSPERDLGVILDGILLW